tara:strand:- start:790 stop:1305 length:516 start_codon:yes stop_codon:yes gene_type:complete
MSFWTTEALASTGTVETGGGDMTPIPAKTQVKAAIDEAKWDAYEGDEYISLRWTVLAPAEFKNRKVFQKIRVNDSAKAEKAKKMLGAIAVNAGGGLLKTAGQPTDSDLQKHLLNKPMALLLQVWKIKPDDGGDEITGNWISSVSPLKSKPKAEPAPAPEPSFDDEDDDVAF